MKQPKYILPALLAISLMVVAFQASAAHANTPTPTSLSVSAPAPDQSINYPNPINKNVTIAGTMTSSVIAPVCSLASPPCAIANSPLYYITVNGWNYRLIFSNSTTLPINHSQIMVTGVYVTPSTFQASQWTPQMYFKGDIYVITYSYVSPYV